MKVKKIVSTVLAAALMFTLIPKIAGNNIVLAATTKDESNTYLGVSGIGEPAKDGSTTSAWSGSYVYFGTYNGNPIKFRVLTKDSPHTSSAALFLDSDAILETMAFDDDSNVWADSDVKTWLNDTFFTPTNFTPIEMGAVLDTNTDEEPHVLTTATVSDWSVGTYGSYVPLSGEKVFLLDAEEASNSTYGYSVTDDSCASRKKTGGYGYWWLRSARSGLDDYAGVVSRDDFLSSSIVSDGRWGVAPALNVDQSKIFLSTAVDSAGTEFKLTLFDDSINSQLDPGPVIIDGPEVYVPYDATGLSHASVLILDKEYGEDGAEIKYFSAFKDNGAFDFPATLDLDDWGSSYYVYVFGEIENGEKKTDYAGKPIKLDKPIPYTDCTIGVNVTTYDSDGKTVITENGGTASVSETSAFTGTEITVTATPASGYTLESITWGNGTTSTDITSAKEFYVEDFNVTVNVVFQKEASTTYSVTVNSGSADVTTAAQGETVTLTAGTAPTGKEFDKWTVVSPSSLTLADATKETTTFTMPAGDVEVTATYKDLPPITYTISVNVTTYDTDGKTVITENGGTASVSATIAGSGKTITVTATPESGYTLKSITWGDGGIAADITSTKEFTIEDFDVAVDVVFQKEEVVSTAPVAAANTYTVIQGADGTWDGKSDYVIEVKSSIDDEHCIDRFKWAAVDGIELKHGENMDLAIGSTIVIIKSDYLKTLSAGTHNIVVNFTDNSVATTLTIDAASTTATSGASVPATGEMQSPLMYVGIAMIVAAAGALSVVIVRKRKEA